MNQQEAKRTTITKEESAMDHWKHRSKNMLCSNCMWFVLKEVGSADHRPVMCPPLDDTNFEDYRPGRMIEVSMAKIGRCRRHAPTISGYPAVFESDWCGDHKLDETKL